MPNLKKKKSRPSSGSSVGEVLACRSSAPDIEATIFSIVNWVPQ